MIEKFKQVTEIYTHASCPDGTASALICAKVAKILGIDPKINFIQYQTPEHKNLEAKPHQLFIDITPPLNRWEDWLKFDPIIIDHHKTAETAVRMLNGVFGDETKSGALLAFEHLMYPLKDQIDDHILNQWEYFAKLVAIRDLWNNNSPDWYDAATISHGLLSIGSKELLESVNNLDFNQIYKLGKLVYDKIKRKTDIIYKSAYTNTIVVNEKELKFISFNLTEPTFSDISEFLRTDYGFDITMSYFYMHSNPCVVISFRSNDKFNVRQLAEKFGGGGHDKAAGCRLQDLLSPSSLIEKMVQAIQTS